ncbi:MAG: ferredoxin [Myxococcota bacterium]|nr:ferredoxin [Myxococcota bacterium]
MKVIINEEECTGCEECVEAVDAVFAMTEDGELAKVKVDVVPPNLEDDVKEAADDCPAEAIIVED